MSQENDRTLGDIEQIKSSIIESLQGLDELEIIKPEFAADIEAMRLDMQKNLEGVDAIAGKMHEETERGATKSK